MPINLERSDRLRELVDELPSELRDVVELVFWCQMSFRDVGKQLGIHHRTAQKRHKKALEVLRAHVRLPQ